MGITCEKSRNQPSYYRGKDTKPMIRIRRPVRITSGWLALRNIFFCLAFVLIAGVGQYIYVRSIEADPHRRDAVRSAKEICEKLAGQPVTVTAVMRYVVRRGTAKKRGANVPVYLWEAYCDTAEGSYVMRLRPETGFVALVKRGAKPTMASSGEPVPTANEALWLASGYLRRLGHFCEQSRFFRVRRLSHDESTVWEMTYDESPAKNWAQTLRIEIDASNGRLNYYHAPSEIREESSILRQGGNQGCLSALAGILSRNGKDSHSCGD